MPDRSTETFATFNHAFTLGDVVGTRPAGMYWVVVDEDEIRGLSFLAYQRVATLLHVPAVGTSGPHQVFTISPQELDIALETDRSQHSSSEGPS